MEISNSFTGIALRESLNSNLIFPPNESNPTGATKAAKTVRAVARYLHAVAVQTLIAPIGAVTHLALAIGTRTVATFSKGNKQQELIDRSWEHLKASGRDLAAVCFLALGIVLPVLGNLPALEYAYNPREAVPRFHQKEDRKAAYIVIGLKDDYNNKYQPSELTLAKNVSSPVKTEKCTKLLPLNSAESKLYPYQSNIDIKTLEKVEHNGVRSYFKFFKTFS